jgi:hypothetical protein
MLGGHSELEPPLPISNRAVKRFCANDSILLVCESRSPPSFLYILTFGKFLEKPSLEGFSICAILYYQFIELIDIMYF